MLTALWSTVIKWPVLFWLKYLHCVLWLFGFHKVKWLRRTGEVDKSVRCSYQIFSGFNVPKIIEISYFWQSYSENKKVDFFEDSVEQNAVGLSHAVLWLYFGSFIAVFYRATSRALRNSHKVLRLLLAYALVWRIQFFDSFTVVVDKRRLQGTRCGCWKKSSAGGVVSV